MRAVINEPLRWIEFAEMTRADGSRATIMRPGPGNTLPSGHEGLLQRHKDRSA